MVRSISTTPTEFVTADPDGSTNADTARYPADLDQRHCIGTELLNPEFKGKASILNIAVDPASWSSDGVEATPAQICRQGNRRSRD